MKQDQFLHLLASKLESHWKSTFSVW
jgi:hypothetical protein